MGSVYGGAPREDRAPTEAGAEDAAAQTRSAERALRVTDACAASPLVARWRLLAATTPGAQFLDFRISTYAPKAYVHTHVHPNKEQIYFFLEGEGVLELGAEKKVVRPNQFAFIPPHLPHGLHNTGNGQLVFIVITTLTDRG